MDDDTKKVLGCTGLIFVALLVGIGLRSKSIGMFFWMAISVVLIFAGLLFSITLFMMDEGKGMKLLGGILLIFSLLLIASVGTFLVTGNYALSKRVALVWQWGKPLSSQVAESLPTAVPVEEERAVTEPAKAPAGQASSAGDEPTPVPSATSEGAQGAQTAPEEQAGPEATDTPVPTATPVATATPKGGVQQAETKPAADAGDTEVSLDPGIESMTRALNQVWALDEVQAADAVAGLRSQADALSGEEQTRALLLAGVAHQRAGELGSARDIYLKIAKDSPETSYAVTAGFLNKLMEKRNATPKEMDAFYEDLWQGENVEGWFLTPGGWEYAKERLAAARQLVDMRSDRLSYDFFQFLHDRSIFPVQLAFLFIFTVIMVGTKLLGLPLYYRSAKATIQLRRLAPEISYLQSLYSSNPTQLNVELMDLYKRKGVNIYGSCLVSVIDLVIMIWIILTVKNYAPQFYMDGASLWWAGDLTTFDLKILLAWCGLAMVGTVFMYLTQPKTTSFYQIGCGTLVFVGAIFGLAYYFKWPALYFVMYGMLMLSGYIINLVLLPIAAATTKD
jgi:membrane protein insertase Oxa1/YidC/SpoIIIJ